MSPVAAPETVNRFNLRDPSTGTVLPLAATRPLGKHDRCDAPGSVSDRNGRLRPGSCGAEAFVRAWIPGVSRPLLFCAHHFRVHEAGLVQIGAYVHDERGRLLRVRDLGSPTPEPPRSGRPGQLRER